jgi:hypothetical protein
MTLGLSPQAEALRTGARAYGRQPEGRAGVRGGQHSQQPAESKPAARRRPARAGRGYGGTTRTCDVCTCLPWQPWPESSRLSDSATKPGPPLVREELFLNLFRLWVDWIHRTRLGAAGEELHMYNRLCSGGFKKIFALRLGPSFFYSALLML